MGELNRVVSLSCSVKAEMDGGNNANNSTHQQHLMMLLDDDGQLSTASTLIGSCDDTTIPSPSNSSRDDNDNNNNNNNEDEDDDVLLKPVVLWKSDEKERDEHVKVTRSNNAIPNTTTDSTRTSLSKLERLRAKTKQLRMQGRQKIADSRESIRLNRTVVIIPDVDFVDENPSTTTRTCTCACTPTTTDSTPPPSLSAAAVAVSPSPLSTSGSVDIDIDIDIDIDTVIDNNNSDLIVVSPLKTTSPPSSPWIGKVSTDENFDEDSNVVNDNDDDMSVHWDESTLSISPPSSPPISPPSIISPISPPQLVSSAAQLLPPPEVERHDHHRKHHHKRRKQKQSQQKRPTSSPGSSVCFSMYNKNQKCQKLQIENDCLKRQLDLLESRHRDWQINLTTKIRRKQKENNNDFILIDDDEEEEDNDLFSRKSMYYRRKKNRNCHRRKRKIAAILVFAPLLVSLTLWSYRTIRNTTTTPSSLSSLYNVNNMLDITENATTAASAAKASATNTKTVTREGGLMMGGSSVLFGNDNNNNIGLAATSTTISTPLRDLALMMREGVLRQFLFRDKPYSYVIKNENMNDENIDRKEYVVTDDDDCHNSSNISSSNEVLAVADYSTAIIQYESKQYRTRVNQEDENRDVNKHDETTNMNNIIYGNDEEEEDAAALGFKRNQGVIRWKRRILSNIRMRIRRTKIIGNSLKQILTKIRIHQDHNSLGVWLKKGRQRAIMKQNAEF
ncbi:hypothetical protein FRACYDRAFT_238262 [Fragilariopsis cylindrus CCMP1102]|uniref:Uncharacterized protein n=1 Tax=Fragilariopsis cylindrus CCMP1102 TaxID=635003 RepID=A0A1E7FJ73_9STRA|nr:hypothetical protein FRACYDRAFT_238262 [Fragilariopsis cylindrus CCMP1102]|eukprot:OEU17833.1 hypothetical protein FRACYDRAFT_238262 [Fragilariopsis cylindrus CCMP1102]